MLINSKKNLTIHCIGHPLAEIHYPGTILAMMEKTAQNWEAEGNQRMAEEIRDQIKGKFFQNFARKQIKDREENGKKG